MIYQKGWKPYIRKFCNFTMEDEFGEISRDFMQDYYGHCAVVTGEC